MCLAQPHQTTARYRVVCEPLQEEHQERQQSQQHLFLLLPLPLLPVYQAADLMFMLSNNKRVPSTVQTQCIFFENRAAGALLCVPSYIIRLTWYLYSFCLQLAKTNNLWATLLISLESVQFYYPV